MTVNIGYGVGLMIGAYVAGGVTGAHMNPAVTLAMALRGKTAWIKVSDNTYMLTCYTCQIQRFALTLFCSQDLPLVSTFISCWLAK